MLRTAASAPAFAPRAPCAHGPAPRAPCHVSRAAQRQQRALLTTARSSTKGDGPLGAWLDLASLVTSGSKAPGVSDFAKEIGSEVFVDVAGWHLVRSAAPQRVSRGLRRQALLADAAVARLAVSARHQDGGAPPSSLSFACSALRRTAPLTLVLDRLAWRTPSARELRAAGARSARRRL